MARRGPVEADAWMRGLASDGDRKEREKETDKVANRRKKRRRKREKKAAYVQRPMPVKAPFGTESICCWMMCSANGAAGRQ